jgi:hypothetical protein
VRVHNLADAYGKLPSEIIHLQTPWGAYQFDEVCLMVGRRVERNVNNGKDPFYGFDGQAAVRAYKGVKGTRPIKKVKFKADGTW